MPDDMAVRYLTELDWPEEIATTAVDIVRRLRADGHTHTDIASRMTAESHEMSPGLVRIVCGD